jgi:hypothetical protein
MKKSLSARTPAVLWRATPVAAAVAAVLASGGAAQAQQAAPAATETPAVVTGTGALIYLLGPVLAPFMASIHPPPAKASFIKQ